jgi:hypothetical protein
MSLSEDCLAAPGSIIAVIIDTHRARKDANEPSRVATPMSIPLISQTATTHDVAASPSVAVSAAVLAPVMAAEREADVIGSAINRVRSLEVLTSISTTLDGTATTGHIAPTPT